MNIFTKSLDKQAQDAINTTILKNISNNLNKILFFDIETTGFSPKNSICYLIGAIYYKDDQWHYIQWFAENADHEEEILHAFFTFLDCYEVLIHFNGDGFDLPFLTGRCSFHQLPYSFEHVQSFDLFKKARLLKNLLDLENYKQKTIEAFLGIHRDDQYSGGDLIKVYKEYVAFHEPEKRDLLLLHNHDDICGMPALLPILNYQAICDGDYEIVNAELNTAKDFEGNELQEILITTKLQAPIPTPISKEIGPYTIRINERTLKLRVPIFLGELKHFYANYKDYYYLPEEDEAMHKSVASFVDKSRRKQATLATCYTRKHGAFLPQNDIIMEPTFKIDSNDKLNFFLFHKELLEDHSFLLSYVRNILTIL